MTERRITLERAALGVAFVSSLVSPVWLAAGESRSQNDDHALLSRISADLQDARERLARIEGQLTKDQGDRK